MRFVAFFVGAAFFDAVPSWAARFSAHRFFVAAMIFLRPSALRSLFPGDTPAELFVAPSFGPEVPIARNADSARSMASFWCSID
jgi:hypothetical protein